MPGGRCARGPFGGYSRVAQVTLKVRGVERTVNFGGVAEAFFPDRSDDQLRQLAPGDAFGMTWKDAVFHGTDAVLGPVTANLRKGGVNRTFGSVTSLATGANLNAADSDFFPAVNKNSLDLEFHIPRFGLVYRGPPVVNTAVIKQIPPYGSTYTLETPVTLDSTNDKSSRFFSALAGETVIQSCNVRLHISGGIACDIVSVVDGAKRVLFNVAATNETATDIEATWMIWPRPADTVQHPVGTVSLPSGKRVELAVEADRNMFYEPKWIYLVGSKPFDVDAGGVVVVPSLR